MVSTFHLGIYGINFSLGYGLFIWVWSFHLGMLFIFEYGLFIRVWSSMESIFWYGIFNSGAVFSFDIWYTLEKCLVAKKNTCMYVSYSES